MTENRQKTISSTPNINYNINLSNLKIIYDRDYDIKQENNDVSNILLENSNLVSPLINIINNYRDDGTGSIQYLLKEAECNDGEFEYTSYAIFNNYEKALIGLLSIAYTSDVRNCHKYNEKIDKWTFNIGKIGLNNICFDDPDSDDPLEKIFIDFHGYKTEDLNNGSAIFYKRCELEEFKTNFLNTEYVYYKLKYGELYKNDKFMNPQPKIVLDWLEQLKDHLNNKN